MKVAILADDFPPLVNGGAAVAAGNMAKQLLALGCEVSVITTCRHHQQVGKVELNGLTIHTIYSNYHPRWRAWRSLYNSQTTSKVKRLLEDLKPDIVHAHNLHYHLSYHCLRLAQQSGAKVFLSAHDVMLFDYGKLKPEMKTTRADSDCSINYRVSWWGQLRVNRWRFNPGRNLVIRYYLQSVEKIFAVSSMLKEALRANGITRPIEVIANSIDPQDWLSNSALEQKLLTDYQLAGKETILFAGHPSLAKGVRQLLKAFAEVARLRPAAILIMVGSTNEEINKLIKDFQLDLPVAKIISLNWSDQETLAALYHLARVVAMPSICFDTFGLVAGEAMASGRPVVVSCLAGISHLIAGTNSGLVINPFKLSDLSQALVHFLADRTEADRAGRLGQEVVERELSAAKTTALILAEYRHVLNS